MWKRGRTDGGSRHEKELRGWEGPSFKVGGGTQPLRLIGHSNVTRSLPKRLGGGTREGARGSLWREEMEQRV